MRKPKVGNGKHDQQESEKAPQNKCQLGWDWQNKSETARTGDDLDLYQEV